MVLVRATVAGRGVFVLRRASVSLTSKGVSGDGRQVVTCSARGAGIPWHEVYGRAGLRAGEAGGRRAPLMRFVLSISPDRPAAPRACRRGHRRGGCGCRAWGPRTLPLRRPDSVAIGRWNDGIQQGRRLAEFPRWHPQLPKVETHASMRRRKVIRRTGRLDGRRGGQASSRTG